LFNILLIYVNNQ